jgi:hypothetical protein
MCLDCNGVETKVYQQYPINIIILENKSMIIIQLKVPTSFENILQQTRLKEFQQ